MAEREVRAHTQPHCERVAFFFSLFSWHFAGGFRDHWCALTLLFLSRSAPRQFSSQEKKISEEMPIPDHFQWTEETFKGMDAWEIQYHMKCDMIMTEVYVAL